MLKLQTLSSGSSGNITYVGNEQGGILIDIGLNLTSTEKLLHEAKIDPAQIQAILITHEHSDHIKGVADFAIKYNTQIWCHQKVSKILKSYIKLAPHYFVEFNDTCNLIGITIDCFPVPHDSRFCMGYTFTSHDAKVGIATDIGQMTETILAHLITCQVIVLESNHDVQKLMANPHYPDWLKRRILSNRGHLSNLECGKAIAKLQAGQVRQVILAHLSEKNNDPNLAYQTIKHYLSTVGITEGRDIFIDVALQSKIGNAYWLD